MPDFRSQQEKRADRDRAATEQTDYKRMYEAVLAENRELNGKFTALESRLDGKLGEVVADFEALKNRFAEQERQTGERAKELLTMSETMQEMVSSGFEQQTDLMERFRADISQRLIKAEQQTLLVEDKNG